MSLWLFALSRLGQNPSPTQKTSSSGCAPTGRRSRTFEAIIRVETFADDGPGLTQVIRLYLMQPNAMRQEYLEPEYFAGNLNLILGEVMWTYIAASENWYVNDLSTLSAAEQPWLMFRQILKDAQDEMADYAFTLSEPVGAEYHLQGRPLTDDAAYALIELWVDPMTFVPSHRDLFDADMNLLVSVRILEVEEVVDGAYVALRLETYDEDGTLKA